uniref:Uncharacterized protein n=1 Tax=Anguilla anguilla TaxID=7936 RepID=A0A0E9WGZ8_ANGAN
MNLPQGLLFFVFTLNTTTTLDPRNEVRRVNCSQLL